MITNTLGLWFDKKRGMAISLALNGASFGGVVGVPLLVAAIGSFGFAGAMIAAADPWSCCWCRRSCFLSASAALPARGRRRCGCAVAAQIRAQAFRDLGFLTLSIAFALVLFAQVGFIVHLISFLDPVIGRERAAVAVALMTAMAVIGRVLFCFVIDRLNQRLASAISFLSQSLALLIVINVAQRYALFAACALFGFSVGNLITLPALIVQREFDPRSFGVLVSLITAINQVTYAFGPGVVGVLRDASGSYTLPFSLHRAGACRSGADHDVGASARQDIHREGRVRRFSFLMTGFWIARRRRLVNSRQRFPLSQQIVQIEPPGEHREFPSGSRGHSSSGRSRYSSTPFWSGSRR